MEMGWRGVKWRGPTIDTGTLEHLAGLAARSQAVAFYLEESISNLVAHLVQKETPERRNEGEN
jgi:hypothetical protein